MQCGRRFLPCNWIMKFTAALPIFQNCACSVETCINSVSRRPRDVSVEVFKTHGRGWGVRARVAINRGKILGIYTGYVVKLRLQMYAQVMFLYPPDIAL